ncbi:MAG: Spy/CpxP family protein refolding chaperone [Holophagaceae bacterium]
MLPLIVLQQPAPPQPPPPPLMAMAQELGLSEAQLAKLKAIHRAHRDAMEDRHEAVEKARKALMDAVRDGGELNTLYAAFSKAHLAALMEARALHAELNGVLTPEQQAKAKALHAAREGGPHGPGAGPGEGPGRGMGRPGQGGPGFGPGPGRRPGPGGPPPGDAE